MRRRRDGGRSGEFRCDAGAKAQEAREALTLVTKGYDPIDTLNREGHRAWQKGPAYPTATP